MNEAKIKVGDQWFYRGNRANSWFATYREGGGLSDRVPTVCWPFLEEIARLQTAQPENAYENGWATALESAAQVAEGWDYPLLAADIRKLANAPTPRKPQTDT